MKDLRNREDYEETRGHVERESFTIRLEGKRTPIYFLSSRFTEGYVHWVQLPDGTYIRAACGGGAEGQGKAPGECPVCKVYQENAKRVKALDDAGKSEQAEKLSSRNYRIKAKYEMRALVAKGEMTYTGKKDGVDQFKVNYEDAEVGILAMSKSQADKFTALHKQQQTYPFMESVDDLFNRTIMFVKSKKTNPETKQEYEIFDVIPAKKPIPRPDVKVEKGKFHLSEGFDIDQKALSKMAEAVLTGKHSKHEVEYEDDDEDLDEEDLTEGDDDADDKASHRKASSVHGKKKVVRGKSKKDDSEGDDEDAADEEDETDSSEDEDADEFEETPRSKKKRVKKDEDEDDDSDEAEESDAEEESDDEEEDEKPARKADKGKSRKSSSDDEFDDSFMDDLDESSTDSEDDFEDDDPEESAVPRRGKKTPPVKRRKAAPAKRPVKRARK